MATKNTLLCGIDQAPLALRSMKTLRWGLVSNSVAMTVNGVPALPHLLGEGFRIRKLFSPEHGFSATGIDGATQPDQTDQQTGLPIISLYGGKLCPTERDLEDIDAILFDIPDVGCRFYTYLWTLTYVMEACAAFGKMLVVLDRPNPIGGDLNCAEGPMLDETHCSSFIGRWSIPIRHSCTLGELARYFAATRLPALHLEVVSVEGWEKRLSATSGSYSFRPTSPAITNAATALLYPGTGLLEGININEGRGTAHPFCCFGAPWINRHQLQEAFAELQVPGIATTPVSYTPRESRYAGQACEGLLLNVNDAEVFRPVAAAITIIRLLMELYPLWIAEAFYPTAANPSGTGHLDKLLGVPGAFARLMSKQTIATDVTDQWRDTIVFPANTTNT
ncbi:exo-beta-N-acetylmuramidase NamZ family protein [Flavihumibacter petaseus]|uniref:DUF1343 domain-containing protein n=1 Tax=Flavihumibacter petaseus NBRC 106054 TaxID=1220578 RepID=A0A0E9N1U5_9BACT|nr:DUF1343 domain-containing protein [Flavihumibacter petaseus]GAO43987.1 hypothetical protein FPE01S_03_00260 [Flavihumibacter petaseus NBRC 106054]